MKKIRQMTAVYVAAVTAVAILSACGAGQSKTAGETLGLPSATMAADITMAATEAVGNNADQGRYDGVTNSMAESYQSAYGGDYLNSEEYNTIMEQGFKSVMENPLSTFSVDVDTAAYSNIRRMINRRESVPADAVRIEEMINYFKYDYKVPEGDIPFSVNTELSECPWNPDNQLLLIGLQGKEIDFENRPLSNLVFLLDVSGSMYSEDKLPLIQKSFTMLTEELTENDRVSIVTYAGYDQVVLEGAGGDQKAVIRDALESLTAGGSTAGSAGINRAYELAERYYIKGGNNRVILATDGDLNVGLTSESELTSLIEEKRRSGVHLSVLGFGTGNIKDNKMEALADNGDGNYYYIDTLAEAKKVLVEEMGGTLLTIAKDVKLQVEFNPVQVSGYRLVGYENRALADEDFANDAVDAGEIGAGHRVTALYEIIPASAQTELKYQKQSQPEREELETDGELLTVNIRFKAPNGQESQLISAPVMADSYQPELPANLRFASAVAEFGMVLRESEYKGDASYEEVLELLSRMPMDQMDDYKDEFRVLVLKKMDP